jgi:hypothetical protein
MPLRHHTVRSLRMDSTAMSAVVSSLRTILRPIPRAVITSSSSLAASQELAG